MSTDYARILLLSNDATLGTDFTPPTNASVIADIFDPNNISMISTGLYTQNQVDTKKATAYQHFIDLFGIDFLAGTNMGYGEYIAGDWILLPYTTGSKPASNIYVALDTDHKDRENNMKWHAFQFGQIIASTAAGTFTAGIHAGETYTAGAVMAYWDCQMIKTNGGPISPFQQRETFVCYATLTGSFFPGCQGLNNFYSEATVVDQDGNNGLFIETIYYRKDPLTGIYSTQTRQVITFNNESESTSEETPKAGVEIKSRLAHLLNQ